MIRVHLLRLLLPLTLAVAWFPIARGVEGQADRGIVRVPAAYVLDGPGTVAIAFGYPGSKGRLCRCDLPEVGSGVTCTAEDSNPLQAALDWAAAHKRRDVRLDLAEYTFSKPQASHIGRIGFHVPSGIHLKGVMVGDQPGSVLTPGIEVNGPEAAFDQQRFEVLLLPSGSKTDRSVPLNDTTIEALFLNNRLLGGVCLWAGGGSGFRLLHVHSMGSRQSSLIIGNYDGNREDPQVKSRAAIYYARDFDIGWNHVHGAHGDGICIIGHNGTIHDNVCENGTTTFDNGITPFIGSTSIRFTHNRIVNFPTAIGLDGSFLPCQSLAGRKSPAESEAQCKRMLWEKYQGWEGYHRRHEIADNEVLNCRRGIVTCAQTTFRSTTIVSLAEASARRSAWRKQATAGCGAIGQAVGTSPAACMPIGIRHCWQTVSTPALPSIESASIRRARTEATTFAATAAALSFSTAPPRRICGGTYSAPTTVETVPCLRPSLAATRLKIGNLPR